MADQRINRPTTITHYAASAAMNITSNAVNCGSRNLIGPIQNCSPTKLNVFYLIIKLYQPSGVVWPWVDTGEPTLNVGIRLRDHAQSKEHPLISKGSNLDRHGPM